MASQYILAIINLVTDEYEVRIQVLCDVAADFAPDYDVDKVFEAVFAKKEIGTVKNTTGIFYKSLPDYPAGAFCVKSQKNHENTYFWR